MSFWRKYFEFSKSELIGVISLFVLILLFFFLRFSNFTNPKKQSFTDQINEINVFVKSFLAADSVYKSKYSEDNYSFKASQQIKLNPFEFNPNTMTKGDWDRLGLRPKQSASILKYLSRGGKFYTKADFAKMYCITPEEFKILEPYIVIPQSESKYEAKKTNPVVFQIELNSSTVEDLLKVPGIGPAFASKIIKYKTVLGGYYSVHQLKEVYGMDSLRYQQIYPYFDVESDSIAQLNINTLGFKELIRHPYISKTTAYTLVQYRQKHGQFKTIEEVKKVEQMSDTLFQKISPYFKLN